MRDNATIEAFRFELSSCDPLQDLHGSVLCGDDPRQMQGSVSEVNVSAETTAVSRALSGYDSTIPHNCSFSDNCSQTIETIAWWRHFSQHCRGEPMSPELQDRPVAGPEPSKARPPRFGDVCAELVGVTRTYSTVAGECHALADVDLEIRSGELLLIRGRSGSGKTTLIQVLTGIDVPTSGAVRYHRLGNHGPERWRSKRPRRAGLARRNGALPVSLPRDRSRLPVLPNCYRR